jgi:cystathionine beta-lyase
MRKVMNMSAIFNGDTIPQRRGTNSVKWDTTQKKFGSSELLPMWVADMDFPSPPCVVKALRESADFGVYGYYAPPASYFHAFIDWENRRHTVEVKEEWLRFTPGVVAGLNWCVQIFTNPGDACVILTPCYYPFINAIADNDRRLIASDLINQNGRYSIDFRDLEEKIIHENVKMLLLCAPHNPVGRVWTEVEMRRIADICVTAWGVYHQ